MIPLHLAQLLLYSAFFIYFEASMNMFMFWLLGLVNFIFLGGLCDKIFECACAWFFRKPEERASYDNLEAMASCISGCLGNLIAVAYVPSLRMAIFFNWLATFFYCFFVLIYSLPHKKTLKKPDDIDGDEKSEKTDQNESTAEIEEDKEPMLSADDEQGI